MDFIVIVVFLVIIIIVSQFGKSKPRQPRPKKATPWDEVKFFVDVNKEMKRDYVLIIDKSGSMGGGGGWGKKRLWDEARDAVAHLAPHITKFDPDGITLYFFSSSFYKYDNITSAKQVSSMFNNASPSGGTNLAAVLKDAIQEHFQHPSKDETILVVTDGRPDNERMVKDVIIDATRRLSRRDELSISFIQIGNDGRAADFLQALDDDLEGEGATQDIVDTLTTDEMGGLSFSQLIQKSLLD